ncbi:MAG: hypothetical protein OEW30_17555 [Acidimicrobiia bacterium]|nr:hypothetical protein [Acidimicrobiia bacterium]
MREDRGYVCFPEVRLGMPFSEPLIEVVSSSLAPRVMRQALTTGHRCSGPEAVTAGIVDATGPLDALLDTASHTVGALAGTAMSNLARIKAELMPAIVVRAGGVVRIALGAGVDVQTPLVCCALPGWNPSTTTRPHPIETLRRPRPSPASRR